MSASLFFLPKARPLDLSGQIMPNAKAQFYVSDSTTPAAVYQDATLGPTLPNPVVADADGEFPFIYMDSAITYRIILYDQNDVEIWDLDPYLPSRDYQPGTIIEWFGIPANLETYYPAALWQILDGTNGTPDAGGRVQITVGAGYDVGDTGGALNSPFTTDNSGAHPHDIAHGGPHTLILDELPPDTVPYNYSISLGPGSPPSFILGPFAGSDNLTGSGGGDPHTHDDGDVEPDGSDHQHTGTVDILQPFYVSYKLMRRY